MLTASPFSAQQVPPSEQQAFFSPVETASVFSLQQAPVAPSLQHEPFFATVLTADSSAQHASFLAVQHEHGASDEAGLAAAAVSASILFWVLLL
ncbi:MAG: hypothetical protein ABL888_14590 [Pirellulaceae bacterium]